MDLSDLDSFGQQDCIGRMDECTKVFLREIFVIPRAMDIGRADGLMPDVTGIKEGQFAVFARSPPLTVSG